MTNFEPRFEPRSQTLFGNEGGERGNEGGTLTSCSQTEFGNEDEAVAPLWEALHDVEDPEFPMSIVDMGLVIDIQKVTQTVRVKMTFTAMGCPCIDMIMEDIRTRLRQEPEVEQVEIEVVWSPPWNKQRMTEQGREIMWLSGVTV